MSGTDHHVGCFRHGVSTVSATPPCICDRLREAETQALIDATRRVGKLRSHIRRRNTRAWSSQYRTSYWTAVRIETVDLADALLAIRNAR